VMFMHSQRLKAIREVLDAAGGLDTGGTLDAGGILDTRGILDARGIGEIKRITSAFSFAGGPEFFAANIRVNPILEPYGSLGDLGWYCIRLALWVMKEQLPRSVTGRILSSIEGLNGREEEAAPSEFSGELIFQNGVSSSFYCSFVTAIEQWAQISGSNGVLRMTDFVLPFFGCETRFEVNNAVFEVKGCDFNMEPHWREFSTSEYSNSHPNAQETNLFRNFAAQVLSGEINESWPAMALGTQRVMHACFESAREGGRPVILTP
jgi:predicted dehydrogenase